MMSQHSNSLATATAAILVHNENLLRLCTKMAAVSMAKGCMQTLYSGLTYTNLLYWRFHNYMSRFITTLTQCGNFTVVIPGYKVFSDVVGEGDPL